MSNKASAICVTRGGESPPIFVRRLVFLGGAAVLFTASVVGTIAWCGSMSAMGEMPMPGGWALSMMWLRMPGQTWPGVAVSFLGMWLVMMIAMMLPSLVSMLSRYRERAAETKELHLDGLTLLVGAGYFFIWAVLGLLVFSLGIALAAVERQWPPFARAVPVVGSAVIVAAGVLQFTDWKVRHLGGCRGIGTVAADADSAWREGLRLGLHCCSCCAGLTFVLLVIGVMDLRAMVAVTAAITGERLLPSGERVARASGAIVLALGLFLIARAAGLG